MHRLYRYFLPSSLPLMMLALTACATLEPSTLSNLPTLNDTAEAQLGENAGELVGKEVITLPAPSSVSAFDFNAAIMSAPTSPPPDPARAPVARTTGNLFDVVSVYWGTDRKLESPPVASVDTSRITTGSLSRLIAPPGTERGDDLVLGRARVTVPKTAREKGELKRPRQITFLNIMLYRETEDPRSHFTLGTLERMDADDFVQASNQQLAGATRFQNEAFIFVHGFNISFENALYRTAQIAYDLEFDGVPYLYSWPSKAKATGYLYDRDSADRARTYFLKFVQLVANKTNAKRIHVIAHSLGARTVIEALQNASGATGQNANLKLGQIILAAPDIDRDVFKEIAGILNRSGKGTTLYAADNDRPLQVSRIIARGPPRAGEISEKLGPTIVRDIDTIDISNAGTDAFLSFHHNTYADSSALLSDMRILMRKGLRPPNKRSNQFEPQQVPEGTYWKYAKTN